MGNAVIDLPVPIGITPVISRRGIQHGEITGVSTFIVSGAPYIGQLFAQVYLSEGDSNPESMLFSFGADYITRDNPLNWKGKYAVQGYEYVITRAYSSISATVRTAINVLIPEGGPPTIGMGPAQQILTPGEGPQRRPQIVHPPLRPGPQITDQGVPFYPVEPPAPLPGLLGGSEFFANWPPTAPFWWPTNWPYPVYNQSQFYPNQPSSYQWPLQPFWWPQSWNWPPHI